MKRSDLNTSFFLTGDPLDDRHIYLGQSKRYLAAGESAFAATHIPEGMVFALYAGFILNDAEHEEWIAKRKVLLRSNPPKSRDLIVEDTKYL